MVQLSSLNKNCKHRCSLLIFVYGLLMTLIEEISGIKTVNLSSGHKMPLIGFGTCQIHPDDIDLVVTTAVNNGYTHIDTAFFNKNERAIGESLKKFLDDGRKREDFFITAKLPIYGVRASDVEKFLKLSLENLDLQYLDMYMIHFPTGLYREGETNYEISLNEDGTVKIDKLTDLISTWKQLEAQVKAGRAKSIGLSNFNESQVLKIIEHAEIKPSNLQIEIQAYNQQKKLVDFCNKHGIVVTSYSTLGIGGSEPYFPAKHFIQTLPRLLQNPVIQEIAENYKKSTAQVLLRHSVQSGIVVIPKSMEPERIKENFNIFDFELTNEEMRTINDFDLGEHGRINDFLNFKGIEKHPEYPFQKKISNETYLPL